MPDTPTPPAKRACDACHRRKVKCIMQGPPSLPCKNCNHAGLKCTFNAPVQKKGPKGCRAKVISELRENQRRTQLSAADHGISSSPPLSPLHLHHLNPLPAELIQCCINYFFTHMWPTQPILDRRLVQQKVETMHASPDDYCLIVSLCAYMMIQPNMQLPPGLDLDSRADVTSNMTIGLTFLQDALEVRKACSHFEHPTQDAVLTSFFLFGCYFCLEKHNTAWFQLREATTLALLLGMHKEDTYHGGDPVDMALMRRLFWLLFITERAYALQTQKPLTLHDTIALPSVHIDGVELPELVGFVHLIMLFKPFDDAFVGLWNQSLDTCNPEWISMLHKQLSDALPQFLRSTETQAVDLRLSQQWLRVMVWQLSISHKLLSSNAADAALTFRYPLQLSRELIADAASFSQESMEVHGIGLVKKLFDVACTLIDVMTCVPYEPSSFEVGPRDYLDQFLRLMSKLRGGQSRYLPMLVAKINEAVPQGLPPSMIEGLDTYSASHSPEQLLPPASTSQPSSSNSSSYAPSVGTPPALLKHEGADAPIMGSDRGYATASGAPFEVSMAPVGLFPASTGYQV